MCRIVWTLLAGFEPPEFWCALPTGIVIFVALGVAIVMTIAALDKK